MTKPKVTTIRAAGTRKPTPQALLAAYERSLLAAHVVVGRLDNTRALRVRATNEWMRRYIEEPARFSREWDTVALFRAEEQAGKSPSYGELCEAYLEQLMGELTKGEAR